MSRFLRTPIRRGKFENKPVFPVGGSEMPDVPSVLSKIFRKIQFYPVIFLQFIVKEKGGKPAHSFSKDT